MRIFLFLDPRRNYSLDCHFPSVWHIHSWQADVMLPCGFGDDTTLVCLGRPTHAVLLVCVPCSVKPWRRTRPSWACWGKAPPSAASSAPWTESSCGPTARRPYAETWRRPLVAGALTLSLTSPWSKGTSTGRASPAPPCLFCTGPLCRARSRRSTGRQGGPQDRRHSRPPWGSAPGRPTATGGASQTRKGTPWRQRALWRRRRRTRTSSWRGNRPISPVGPGVWPPATLWHFNPGHIAQKMLYICLFIQF